MKKPLLSVIVAITALLTSQALAADPEFSLNATRLLAYRTVPVTVGVCETSLTPGYGFHVKAGLQEAARARTDLMHAEFADALNAGLPDADLLD